MNKSEISEKVKILINKLGLKNPPVPVEDVAKLLNIRIVMYDKFAKDFSGMIVETLNAIVIGVNSTHPTARQRFTIAHELGHYLLGHEITDVLDEHLEKKPNQEKEANIFAAELLMPKEMVEVDAKKGTKISDLARKYNVSEQAMTVRMLDTGLINEL